MTKRTAFERTAAALRDLDPATTTTLTEEERQRADAMLARILATPGHEHGRTETDRPRQRRGRVLIPVGLLTAAAVAVPTALGGGSAFASWTPTPEPLPPAAAEAAATTCLSSNDTPDQSVRVIIGERRGGWTYVLLVDGRGGEHKCLMPDDLVGAKDFADRRKRSGFFGSYTSDPPEAPTPSRDSIIENETMGGAVPRPGRLPFAIAKELGLTTYDWFTWVSGYAGSDVTGVTVHTGSGLDIEASLKGGRFSAWWPARAQSSDHPAETWSYTVTLADGTTRRVDCVDSQADCA